MADRMRAVAAAAAGIVRTRSLEHLQEVLREAAARVVDFDAFTLALLDAEARALVFVPGEDAGIAVPGNTVPLAGRPSEVVLRERRSVVTRRAGEAAAQGADLVGTGRRSESAIRSPIVAGDEVLGVLSVQSYTPGRYGPGDVEVLETLASLAAVAVTDQRLRAQRDRSVEALLQREARFRAMIEGAEDMVLLVTAAGTLGYCSPSVTRVLGYGPDQLRGRDAFSLVHPSHRDAVHAAFGRRTDVVGVGEPMRFLVRHAGGGWRRLEARASNLLGSPAVAGVVVNARDVTREAVIEEALRESEWHFRQLVQTSPDGLLVETGDRIRFANPAAIHMLGADSLDELAERSLLDLVDPDGRAAVGAAMRAAREDRAARPRLEQRFLRRDGQELFGEVILSGIPWAGEAAVQVILRDTTERRRAAAALTLQQAYLEQLFESAPEGIVLLDLQDRVVRANAEFGRIFGYAPAEVVGRRINDLIAPDAAEASAISARAALGETVRAETVRRHRDGSPLHVSVLGAPVSVAGGPVAIYGIYRDISAQKALEEQLIRHAFHDPLTDLPNRALLLDRLERAALRSRGQGSFAVLFLDLDNLKYVNDSLGHAAGDRLLLMVARRLVQVVREGDTVARLSGDEFVLLLEELESPEVAVGVAQRVAEQLEAPFSIGDAQMGATASIGIAFGPAPGAGPEQVLRNADAAMYRAKSSGRGQHAVFDPAADRGALSRGGMRAELRRAIDAGELVLHYQPIAGLAGGGAAGCEALVRWQHPQRGLLGPADFVPLAEECGLIAPIGDVVLREAIRQLAAWQARPGAAPGTFVSVNVSVQQLSPSLPPRIREWLEEAGVAPECLWVEVTESGVVGPTDEALGVLHAVRALGVRIAIDDFGTGYSALSYLAHLPADVLKVDRSFVSDLREDGGRANQLVEGIVRLAHSLGMEVVAEGIETPHQLAQLTAMGCDRGQGFHLGRPAPPADAAPWTVLAG